MLREMASSLNVHIALVIHPKKVDDEAPLSISSVFGTAKVTQEADTVMILQRPREDPEFRVLQIAKNRYDGDVGSQWLGFDTDSRRYIEVSDFERV